VRTGRAASRSTPSARVRPRAGELTAKRLLTLHNLTFMERLMRRLREAIADGAYEAEAERVLSASARR
jgi:tRNA-guanine family transglycosylase